MGKYRGSIPQYLPQAPRWADGGGRSLPDLQAGSVPRFGISDGSDTLILGRPTGKGSWETPDPVPVSVKREDANYILERSIPLMQRRMSQDKKRAQNKKRSRSGQLDISD